MRNVIVRQIYFTGIQAFRIVSMAALILGAVTVAQSASQLQRLGGADALGPIVVGAFVREIGPLLVLIVVVARSVSAIASELSSMKANGEIDGLRGVGVSPLSYLVLPRVVSGAVATTVLAMHFVWIALLSGFLVSQLFLDLSLVRYLEQIAMALQPIDLLIFVLKTSGMGLMVFFLACYCGLRTSGAVFEIPQATTKAVMWSFSFCFLGQMMVSAVYYLHAFQGFGWVGF